MSDVPWFPWSPRRRLALYPQPASFYVDDWRELDFYRAGGDVVCTVCGLVYYDHPNVPGAEQVCPTLMVTCMGDIVKV